jgi:hypothetical protein
MTRMNEATRKQAATDLDVIHRVVEAGVQCDHCDERATVPVVDGITSAALCAGGYLAHVRGLRAERAANPGANTARLLALHA